MIESQVGRSFVICCMGIYMFGIHWQRQNLLTFRPNLSDSAVFITSKDPQDVEKALRDCKAQDILLLSTVQEQYFSTPFIGLLPSSYVSDVYMVF